MPIESNPSLQPDDALLIVDMQNDFLPGGSLAVPDGDQVIAPLNEWLARFAASGLPVFATRCWHPPDHCSFQAQGGPWPPHCVAGTAGADFHPNLDTGAVETVFLKGQHAAAYSGFEGTDEAGTPFSLRLVPDRFYPSFGIAQYEPSRTYAPRPAIPPRWSP